MTTAGTFHLHFNRHGAAPLVWCVVKVDAMGQRLWELAVPSFTVHGVTTTRYVVKATPDDEDGRPSAWLECAGELEVLADGSAVIWAVAL